MNKIEQDLLAFHCPRWDDLPDVELYVDQVVNYVEKHIAVLDLEKDTKILTASMINNYVKMKLIPAPVKKRYNQKHLARLIVICSLKRDFSITELSGMTDLILKRYDPSAAYDFFCAGMEYAIHQVFTGETQERQLTVPIDSLLYSVMTAFANKLKAHCLVRDFLDDAHVNE